VLAGTYQRVRRDARIPSLPDLFAADILLTAIMRHFAHALELLEPFSNRSMQEDGSCFHGLCYSDARCIALSTARTLSFRNFIYCKSLSGFVLMTLLVVAHSSGQTIAPVSGKAMCSAVTPDDFTKAGVPVSRLREANLDDNKSAYCIYDGKAGKAELDIFYPAGDTPAEGQNAQRAAQSAIGGKFEPVCVAGADEASTNAASPKDTD
jgi:hypothetical protein